MGDEKKHFSFRLFSFLSFFFNEDRKEREGEAFGDCVWGCFKRKATNRPTDNKNFG